MCRGQFVLQQLQQGPEQWGWPDRDPSAPIFLPTCALRGPAQGPAAPQGWAGPKGKALPEQPGGQRTPRVQILSRAEQESPVLTSGAGQEI